MTTRKDLEARCEKLASEIKDLEEQMTDLETAARDLALYLFKELVPYLDDKQREDLIKNDKSTTYKAAYRAFLAGDSRNQKRIEELEAKLKRTSSCEQCGYSTMTHEPIAEIDELRAALTKERQISKLLEEGLKFYAQSNSVNRVADGNLANNVLAEVQKLRNK